jgi:hypothetical protein
LTPRTKITLTKGFSVAAGLNLGVGFVSRGPLFQSMGSISFHGKYSQAREKNQPRFRHSIWHSTQMFRVGWAEKYPEIVVAIPAKPVSLILSVRCLSFKAW